MDVHIYGTIVILCRTSLFELFNVYYTPTTSLIFLGVGLDDHGGMSENPINVLLDTLNQETLKDSGPSGFHISTP